MTDHDKSKDENGFRNFHKSDDQAPMTAEERKRLNEAFGKFIESIRDKQRKEKLQQEELHGDH